MKWSTREPEGYLPAGMRVEEVTLSLAGGRGLNNRDGGAGGNGKWLLVKYPNGVFYGQVRTQDELRRLGIHPENLAAA